MDQETTIADAGGRQITLAELMSCTADGKRIVAESIDTGQPVHIEDAFSGLACRCICPNWNCGRSMVAHKGSRRRHFQHAPRADGTTCLSTGETALHKFAKTALEQALRLKLPELKESDGRNSLDLVQEGEFTFDSAKLEVRQGAVVPDVVCRKGERALYVEFKVTHACGPDKIQLLKEMNVGAIEIDLSFYRGHVLTQLTEAILTEAPRIWLHNPRSAAARGRLAKMERQRLDTLDDKARRMLTALGQSEDFAVEASDSELTKAAMSHDLGDAIAAEGRAVGFVVNESEWKAFILLRFGLAAKEGFTATDAYAAIKAESWIATSFISVSEDLAAALRRVAGPELLTPQEAILDFIEKMKKADMPLGARFGMLHGGSELNNAINAAIERQARPQRRSDQLRSLVDQILTGVRKLFKEDFSFDAWLDSKVLGIVPAAAIASDGEDFDQLVKKLQRLRTGMSSQLSYVPGDETLGLPVLGEVAAREKTRRESEERQQQEAAEKAEKEADDREASLTKFAEETMGAKLAEDWLNASHGALHDTSPRAMARGSAMGLSKAVGGLDHWREVRQREIKRENVRLDSLEKLRKAAILGFKREDLAALWMRQGNRGLEGQKPEECCVDAGTLAIRTASGR
jgi:hypothetical protein